MFNVKNLTVGYSNPLLSSLNFSLSRGDILFLAGPNGSGKSALLKTLSGSIAPIAGKIEVSESPILIHSHFEVQSGLTGHDIFDLFEVYSSAWYDKTWLENFKISTLLDKPFDQLSSGERQRILLCAGLFYKSDVVLFDEPLSYLDWSFYFVFMEAVRRYREKNRIFIMANHDLNFSLQFKQSNTLLLISSSQILYDETEKVLNDKRLENLFNIHAEVFVRGDEKLLLLRKKL